MNGDQRVIMSSKVGRFIFYPDVILSHAKLIRDAVTGQICNPNPNEMRIRMSSDAPKYVHSFCDGSHKHTPFTFVMN